MGFYNSVEISATGLSAERLAMDVIANNIANVNSTHGGPGGGTFKRQLVVFSQKPDTPDNRADSLDGQDGGYGQGGVQALGVTSDPSPDKLVFDPTNPDADPRGYVHMPNVEVVKEMVDMMAASRAYEANVTAIQEARAMGTSALNLLRS
ncbi:MAG: flagellar basal body rod protein FlgC [Vulcanimicrobiaceae bacterium]